MLPPHGKFCVNISLILNILKFNIEYLYNKILPYKGLSLF